MKKVIFIFQLLIGVLCVQAQNISSSSSLILPQAPSTTYIAVSGSNIRITSGQSVVLQPGTHLQAGSSVTIKIGNSPHVTPAISNPSEDLDKNWVQHISYDEDGNVVAESKSFFDAEGKPLQSQVKNISDGHVLAHQPIYDVLGRPAVSTLPAPTNNASFAYKGSFVENTAGGIYDYANFDLQKTTNPDVVANTTMGTLGWYYSNNNTLDASVAATAYPYNRTDFYQDGTGVAKRSAGPSEQLKMGSGHEVSGNSFPVINELNHYKSIRDKFFTSDMIGESLTLTEKSLQEFNVDENGNKVVSITDLSGNSLMSAIITSDAGLNIENSTLLKNASYKYFKEVFINNNNLSFSIRSSNVVIVYLNGVFHWQGIGSDFSYTSTYNSTASLIADFKITSQFPFEVTDASNCQNCPSEVYESDKAFHYFALFKPSIVTFTGTGEKKIYNMSTDELEISGFTSGSTLPAGYYKAIVNGDASATLSYSNSLSNISYNYYNQLGQLIATIAPEGVKAIIDNGLSNYATLASVPFVNTYEYDLQGRLIAQTETDAGRTEYIYRKDGNIRFSQNALQRTSNKFFYTHYDRWARPIESGEYIPAVATFNSLKTNEAVLENTEITGGLTGGTTTDWVKTYYDVADNTHGLTAYQQDEFNLRGAVSHTENASSHTWYNYDEQGRVSWMIKKITGLGAKTINYTYNAQSNVNKVDFQKDTPAERFIHEYEYDADGRLKVAFTGTTSTNRKEQARYYYYLHGPLKRVELAENLQGIDYTYTAQGWLKAINHPDSSKDPGKDGIANSFATDAFGMTLEYFSGDYNRSGTGISSLASGTAKTYYNGHIVAQSWRSQKPSSVINTFGAAVNNPAMFTYEYDDKYQFSNNKYGTPDFGANTFTEALNKNREHGLSYDANGNIKSLNRTNKDGTLVNNFNYNYQTGTNKLTSVDNYASYEYDALGQMTKQQKGLAATYLAYDVSGKVTAIYSDAAHTTLKVSYAYDEAGMRIKKTDHVQNVTTYYIHDAGGNVMAVYDNNGTTLQQKELPVYAAGRVGTYRRLNNSYQYELTDHLGNVRVVLNQNKTTQGLADVVYYSDYYPYGSPLSLANNDYRYGYQGQYAEADKETTWNAFELRNYDAAIGRWLSVDPYRQYASPYVGMGNNPISGIDPDGGWNWLTAKFKQIGSFLRGEDPSGLKKVGGEWGYNLKPTEGGGANFIWKNAPESKLDGYLSNSKYSYSHTYFNPNKLPSSGAIAPNYFFEEMIIGGKVLSGGISAVRYGFAAKTSTNIKYLGRMEDLKGIPRSQTILDDLPNLGSPKANYYQNMSVIRRNLREGVTFKDASWFRPNSELAPTLNWPTRTVGQTFYGAERNLMQNRGLWTK